MIPAPGISNDENAPEGVHAHRYEPLLIGIIVEHRNRAFIMEYRGGVREIDPMLTDIRGGLSGAPLDFHRLMICTHVHTVKDFPRDALRGLTSRQARRRGVRGGTLMQPRDEAGRPRALNGRPGA